MKKVYEKMITIVQICFSNSHKDSFFPSQLYQLEKDQYYFKGFIKKQDVKKEQTSQSQLLIED